MRTMYDSTSPWDIPRNAQLVAGYVDGRYTWPQAWWDMFPNSVHVRISAVGRVTAPVGDVEDGCIWPVENAVDWVLRARADGYDPTIYINQANDWRPCKAAFAARGVPEPHWWVAKYDGVALVPPGAVAKQYAHPADPPGSWPSGPHEVDKHYDVSAVDDYWPGIDKGDDDMNREEFLKTPLEMQFSDRRPPVESNIQAVLEWTDNRHEVVMTGLAGIQHTLAVLADRIGKLETSGVPVTVDYQAMAVAVNDLADARRRDDDPGTGPRS